ncbi:MAG: O-antigen ligase family protein [Lentisphaerae bacterium]|nr:O-antigen ligase family protein [Lentisphaerota bacterium]
MIEVSIIISGGATGWLMGFVTLLPEYTMESVRVGEAGLARISSGRTLGLALIAMALVFRYRNLMKSLLRFVFLAGGILLVLLSGFRSVLIAVMLILTWWFWVRSRHRVGAAVLILTAFLLAWVTAVLLGHSLPGPFQRALSFLPGVYVDPVVAISADASITWRLEIWKQCIKHVPEFLLVGRGIVTDVISLAWMRREFYISPEFYYEMKGYHSGPFSLLLDFGLTGFIAGTLFFVSVCTEGWAFLRRSKPDYSDVIWRYYLYLLISTSVSALSFYLITGDVRASLPLFVIDAIVLRLVRMHLAEARRKPEAPAPAMTLVGWRDRVATGRPAVAGPAMM